MNCLAIGNGPEACRSRLNVQAVSDQFPAIPGLIDINPFRADAPAGYSPLELICRHCSKYTVFISMKEISGGTRAQVTQFLQLVGVDSSAVMIVIDVVIIAGSQRAPGNPAGSAVEGNKSRRPEVECESRSRKPAPAIDRAIVPAAIVVWQPSPGFIGNPRPAKHGTITPPPNRIWRP